MNDFVKVDIFSDEAVTSDPYDYFEYLRELGPVARVPNSDLIAVTGYEEGNQILRDDKNFSAVNTTTGPFLPLEYDHTRDIDEQIAQVRVECPFATTIVNEDRPQHDRSKAILNGIITPVRLKENEAFMNTMADELIDSFIDRGSFEAVSEYGQLFAQLVIADLLGVPKEHHDQFKTISRPDLLPGTLGGEFDLENSPFVGRAEYFYNYIQQRRESPQQDGLTRLAQQKNADGSLPDVMDVVAVAVFLFGAGEDTTVQLFAAMLRFLSDNPGLEDRLRENRELIPNFIEEVLRLQGTVKSTFRYVRKPVTVGGVDLDPGTHVMLHLAAMNRDPRRFENPNEFNIDRDQLRMQMSFGRGLHACAGSPLARTEARVTLERMLDRMKNIRLDESKHGALGNRHYNILMNYSLRGVTDMHVQFDRIA